MRKLAKYLFEVPKMYFQAFCIFGCVLFLIPIIAWEIIWDPDEKAEESDE